MKARARGRKGEEREKEGGKEGERERNLPRRRSCIKF